MTTTQTTEKYGMHIQYVSNRDMHTVYCTPRMDAYARSAPVCKPYRDPVHNHTWIAGCAHTVKLHTVHNVSSVCMIHVNDQTNTLYNSIQCMTWHSVRMIHGLLYWITRKHHSYSRHPWCMYTPAINEGCTRSLRISHASRRLPYNL